MIFINIHFTVDNETQMLQFILEIYFMCLLFLIFIHSQKDSYVFSK